MIQETPIPVGARVRLRHTWDFLALRADTATVIGPGDAAGLVRIRLDWPAACMFEEDEAHEVVEMAETAENLEIIGDT